MTLRKEILTDKECYRKLYGDLIYTIEHYYPKPKPMSQEEIKMREGLAQMARDQQVQAMNYQQMQGGIGLQNPFQPFWRLP